MSSVELQVLFLSVACNRGAAAVVRRAIENEERLAGSTDFALVASELVNNAVMHSGAGPEDVLEVRAWMDDEQVRVSVRDPGLSGQEAQVQSGGQLSTGGFGLQIVQQLATQWGANRHDGYQVWAEMATHR